jgi:RNA polymerase sigma-70 factor (ECF subfamily)
VDDGASKVGVEVATERSQPFEDFFEAERPRLFATLVLILASRSDAEEIAQEAFVRVWERWDRVQTHPDPTGYLYRTAMNLVRQRRRRLRLATRTAGDASVDTDAFSLVEEREDLVRALRSLTPRQRAALVLTELLDLDVREAASMLQVRPATIRSLCSQGRQRIRLMAGEEP